MIVIVEGIPTVIEQRYDLFVWCMLLVDGGGWWWNPTKTQVCLFHMRNRECGKQINIS